MLTVYCSCWIGNGLYQSSAALVCFLASYLRPATSQPFSNTIIDCIVLLHGQNEPLFDSEINRQTSDTPTHPSRHRLPSPCRNDRDGKRPSSDGFRPVIIRLNNVSKTTASSVPDCNSRSLRFYHMKTAERDEAVLSCDPQLRHSGVFSDHD